MLPADAERSVLHQNIENRILADVLLLATKEKNAKVRQIIAAENVFSIRNSACAHVEPQVLLGAGTEVVSHENLPIPTLVPRSGIGPKRAKLE